MAGAAGLGGLNPKPVNAPQGATPAPGVQPGQSTAVVVANKVIVFGPKDGLFIYTGTPAHGNPPIFSVTAPGTTTDPYGNPVKPVMLAGPAAGPFTQIDQFGDLISFSPAGGSIVLDPSKPQIGLFDVLGSLRVIANNLGEFNYFPQGNPGNAIAVAAVMATSDSYGNSFAAGFNGNITAFQPGVSPQVPETWHPMSPLAAGFSAGGTTPQFKLYPDGTIGLRGAVNLTATEPAGTTFFTLSAAYAPTATMHFVTQASLSGNSLGAATIQVLSTGAVQIAVNGGSGGFVNLDGIRFPVD